MSFQLVAGTCLAGRWVVKKLLRERGSVRVYQVRDAKVTDKTFWLFEYEAVLKDAFNQALELMSRFEHENLVQVADSFWEGGRGYVACPAVDGLSLLTVAQMSLGPLPERQILPWLRQVAAALCYLHSRPRPFVIGRLDPATLQLTSDERIVVTSYGLEHLAAGRDPDSTAPDFVAFGHLVQWLLTGDEHTSLDGRGDLSPDLIHLVSRCLAQKVRPTWQSFQEVEQILERLAAAPAPAVAPRPVRPASLDLPEAPPWWAWVSRLPVVWVGRVLALLAIALSVLVIRFNPVHRFARTGPLLYAVMGEGHVVGLDALTGEERDRWSVHDAVILDSCPIRDGQRLLLLDGHENRIMVFDTATDELVMDVAVDQGPAALFPDEAHEVFYCVSSTSGNISVVSLLSLQLVNVFTLPHPPTALAASPDGRWIYAVVEGQDRLYVLDAATGRVVADEEVEGGPHAIAVSPDGNLLAVACPRTDRLWFVDVSAPQHPATPAPTSIPDRRPTAVRWTGDGLRLLVLCAESSSLVVLGAVDRTVQYTAHTGGVAPVAWCPAAGRQDGIWIAHRTTHNVTLMDLSNSGRVEQTFSLPQAPGTISAVP